MRINAYLNFAGKTAEAIDFYTRAIGAELLMFVRFRDAPVLPEGTDETMLDLVMHASFRIGETVVMACDGRSGDVTDFRGFSLSLDVATPLDAERGFTALLDGGEVVVPLGETFWSPAFGMLRDRFGLEWMVGVNPE